jgi:pimeloyl-ACP methyl ester carboxylesterase
MKRQDSAEAIPSREHDATVTVAGVEIACRLTAPVGSARGAVLLVPGSLYSDVDGNYPSMNWRPHAYADLARQLGERGFFVLRMAKIGPGTGSRTIAADVARRHLDFLTRVDVASAGLASLRHAVSDRPVIVAGHSEGAVVGSLLASGPEDVDIDGVVSLSGPALPILSIMRTQVMGMAPPGVEPDMTLFDRTVAAIRAGDGVPAEARSHPQTAMLASMPEPAIAYLRSADRVDPAAALSRVRRPVLIVQGGRDDSVPPAHADSLCIARNGQPTELAVFPNLTHFYKVAPANLTAMEAMALESPSDPAVADAIAAWARRI